MKATKPDWAKAVTPIKAINKIIIGNIWNFLLSINNSKTSLTVDIRDNLIFLFFFDIYSYNLLLNWI